MAGLLDSISDNQEATPQEQAQYEKAVKMLEKLVLNREMLDRIAKTLTEAESPLQGIATAAAKLMIRMENSIRLEDAVKLELVGEVIGEVAEIAEELELISANAIDENTMEQLMALGTEEYARLKQGGKGLDPAQQKQQLIEMQQDGTLNQGLNAMSNEQAAKMRELLGMMEV